MPGLDVPVSSTPCSQYATNLIGARLLQIPASQSWSGHTDENYYMCYSTYSYATNFNVGGIYQPVVINGVTISCNVIDASSTSQSGRGPATLLSAVILPDGNAYTFTYDPYLSLSRLGLPTGGSISYTWQNIPFKGCSYSNPISRALQTRKVNPGNGQPIITTQYQWPNPVPTNAGWSPTFPIYSVATDSNGNDTEYTIDEYFTINEVDYYQGCSRHDANCGGSPGTLLRSVAYTRQQYLSGGAAFGTGGNPAGDILSTPPLMHELQAMTTDTAAGGQIVSKTTTSYASGYGTCQQYFYPVTTPGGTENWPLSGGAPPTYSSVTIPTCYYSLGNHSKAAIGYHFKTGHRETA